MPKDFASVWRKNIIKAERDTLEQGLTIARVMSSGPYDLTTLRKLGHPYSRAKPDPPLHPSIINFQSGEFYEGWKMEMYYSEDGAQGRLVNETRHADIIENAGIGKSRMIKRNITTVLERRILPIQERNVELAFIKTIQEVARSYG